MLDPMQRNSIASIAPCLRGRPAAGDLPHRVSVLIVVIALGSLAGTAWAQTKAPGDTAAASGKSNNAPVSQEEK